MLAHSSNPKSAVDARLDEFEVWTPGPASRNVALAASGAKAVGVTGRESKDFVEAYGVDLVIDGKYGARWFVGNPAVLTIALAKPEKIDRVVFSHDRTAMSDVPVPGLGPALAEYEVHVSSDGEEWTKVADSFDRQPFSPAIARERKLRQFTEPAERGAGRGRSAMASVGRSCVVRHFHCLGRQICSAEAADDGVHGGDPRSRGTKCVRPV
jgi:hypothetical protein